MGSIRFCGCDWAQVRGILCRTKVLCTRFPTRPEEDKERQGPRAVKRRERSKRQSGKGDGQRKAAAGRGAGTCGPRGRVSQRERMSQRSWYLCGDFVRVHARDSTEAQNTSKVPPPKKKQTSPFLRLGLTQVRACLFSFLPLSIIYVASVVCL